MLQVLKNGKCDEALCLSRVSQNEIPFTPTKPHRATPRHQLSHRIAPSTLLLHRAIKHDELSRTAPAHRRLSHRAAPYQASILTPHHAINPLSAHRIVPSNLTPHSHHTTQDLNLTPHHTITSTLTPRTVPSTLTRHCVAPHHGGINSHTAPRCRLSTISKINYNAYIHRPPTLIAFSDRIT